MGPAGRHLGGTAPSVRGCGGGGGAGREEEATMRAGGRRVEGCCAGGGHASSSPGGGDAERASLLRGLAATKGRTQGAGLSRCQTIPPPLCLSAMDRLCVRSWDAAGSRCGEVWWWWLVQVRGGQPECRALQHSSPPAQHTSHTNWPGLLGPRAPTKSTVSALWPPLIRTNHAFVRPFPRASI